MDTISDMKEEFCEFVHHWCCKNSNQAYFHPDSDGILMMSISSWYEADKHFSPQISEKCQNIFQFWKYLHSFKKFGWLHFYFQTNMVSWNCFPLNNGNLNFKYWWWWGQEKYKLCLLGGTELAEIISAQWDKNSILIIVCYKKLLKQLLKLFTCLPFLRSSCLVNIQTSASTGYGMELAEKACRGWLPFFVTLILWRTNIFQSKAQKYFCYNLYEALWAGPANERNVKWSHHINIINLDTVVTICSSTGYFY